MSLLLLLLHTTLAVQYAYGLNVYLFGITAPEEFMINRTKNYGHFKFLTFWNMLLQCSFFTLATVNDLINLCSAHPPRPPPRGGATDARVPGNHKTFLHRRLDFMFATVVFSTGMFVSTSFWVLYHIDRNLIFPVIFDTFFPRWLNHNIHSMPVVGVLVELVLVSHTFPSKRKGFAVVAFFSCIYMGWVLYIAHVTGHWVYPILAQLSVAGRAAFIAAMAVLNGTLFMLGYKLDRVVWGAEVSREELLYHKKE